MMPDPADIEMPPGVSLYDATIYLQAMKDLPYDTTFLARFAIYVVVMKRGDNVLVQWDVDPESVVDESMRELKAWSGIIPFFQRKEPNAKIDQALTTVHTILTKSMGHPVFRQWIRESWIGYVDSKRGKL